MRNNVLLPYFLLHCLCIHKWWSSALFSSNSSMHTKSIDVAFGPICSLAHQHHLLLRKNWTIDVLVVFMSWIIICTNCIFTLYDFPFPHSKHDECDSDLTANSWIFNTPLFTPLNSFSIFVLFNNFVSSFYLRLYSLLCASFSLTIHCSFSIALSTPILLWIPKLRKCTQLPTININCFQRLPHLSHP
jgi:hypothetical protein